MGNGVMKSTISVAGEKEYREALKACKQSLQEMKSELDLVKNAFAENSTSMEAYRQKAEALTRVQEAYERQLTAQTKAIGAISENVNKHRAALEDLSKQIRENNAEIEKETQQYGKDSEEVKKLAQETSKLEKSYSDHTKALQSSLNEQSKLRTEYNKTVGELNDLNREIEANAKAMASAEQSSGEYADNLKDVGSAADQSAGGLDLAGLATEKLQQLLTVGGIIAALKMLKDGFDEVIDTSREFESSFAGVLKTVNAAPAELKELRDQIIDLSNEIPMTVNEIAGIAEAAGQLGIETDAIIGFSETMAKLGVATDVTAENAATMLAQFAKVTGMDSSDYERLGSVIVDLGNNFATTESKIIEMAQRISGAGSTVGLSESDIMAIAAAVSSVGIEAEAGGSAISKLLKQIETATKTYGEASETINATGMAIRDLEMLQSHDSKAFGDLAESLGITTSKFKELMESAKLMEQFAEVSGMTADQFIEKWGTDAVGALNDFVLGLNDTERTGKTAVEILSDMEITEVRMSDAILRLSGSNGALVEAQERANQAWADNIALNKEAEARFETTDSKVQLLSNSFETFKILIGDLFKPAFDSFIEGLDGIIDHINGVLRANYEFRNQYIETAEDVRTAMESQVEESQILRGELETTNSSIEDHRGEVEALISRVEELGSKDHLTAEEEDELRKALEKLNEIMPDTAGYYMDLASGSSEAAKSVRDLLSAEIAEAKFQANKEAYIAGQKNLEDLNKSLDEASAKYNELYELRSSLQKELDEKFGGYDPFKYGNVQNLRGVDKEYAEITTKISQLSVELNNLGGTISKTRVEQQKLSTSQDHLLADMESYQNSLVNTAKASADSEWLMTDDFVNAEGDANKKRKDYLDKLSYEEYEAQQEANKRAADLAKQAAKDAEKQAKEDQKAAEKRLKEEEKERKRLEKEEEKRLKEEEKERLKQEKEKQKALEDQEKELNKWAKSKGGYFPSDIAKNITKNSSQVTKAVTQMVQDAGTSAEKTASAVGTRIADAITSSMKASMKLGDAVSESIASGQLTVNGRRVASAGSYSLEDLGLQVDQRKYDDWLQAMYAKGFDSSLSGAEIAKMLNMGIGVSSAIPGAGNYDPNYMSDALINEMNLLAQEALGIYGSGDNENSLTRAMKAEYESQFTGRQLAYFASQRQNEINRERGYYTIGDQAYDYYSGQPIQIINNFNVEVESPATAAKKIQESVEVALYNP